MALREDQIAAAVRFLGNEKVSQRPPAEKEEFLKQKGLSPEEIAEAVRRHGASEAAAATDASASGLQSQWSVGASVPSPQPALPTQPAQAAQPSQSQPLQQPQSGAFGSYPGAGAGLPPPYGQAAYQPMPPWALQMAMPPPEPVGGGLLGWLLAGLGGAGLGAAIATLLAALRRPALAPSLQPGSSGTMAAGSATFRGLSAAEGGGNAGSADAALALTEDPRSSRAAYEDLAELLRQQREEQRETSAYHAKVIQQLQDQNKQLFGEMQKLLSQQLQQQKAQMTQPTELSAASLRQLAELLQPTPAQAAAPVPSAAAVSLPASVSAAVPAAVAGAPSAVTPSAASATAGNAACGTALPSAGVLSDGSPSAASAGVAPGTGAAVGGQGGVLSAAAQGVGLRESLGAISQALQRMLEESSSKAEAAKSLQTLAMILQNLLGNPTSEKHRKVNTSSSRFRELLGRQSAAAELLRLAGFQFQEPNFVFVPELAPDGSGGPLGVGAAAAQRVRDLVQDMSRGLDQAWGARGNAAAGVALPDGGHGDEAPAVATPAPPYASATAPARPWFSTVGPKDVSKPRETSEAPPAPASAGLAATPDVAAAAGVGSGAGSAAGETEAVARPASAPSASVAIAAAAGSSAASASANASVSSGGGHSAMAHPAESQDRPPAGLVIAHPAESDGALAPPAPLVPAAAASQTSMGSQAAAPAASAQPQVAMAVAHPAESSSANSEQMQSGG